MGTPLSPQAHQTLSTLPAFRGLAEADRERVAALFREECLPRGTVVFREGDAGSSLCIVASGEVRVDTGGRTVAHLGPGEWFGEMSLITGARRSATVEVALDCHLLTLDAEAFGHLLAIHPSLHEQLATILSRRLLRTSRGEGVRRGYELVFVDHRAGWPDITWLVELLSESLEEELGQPIAIVGVAPHGGGARLRLRESGPDAMLTGDGDGAALRERLATRLATLGAMVPLILVVVDRALGEAAPALLELADTVLVLADGEAGAEPLPERQRRIVLYDRRRGPAPPFSGPACAVLLQSDHRRPPAIRRLARCLTHRAVGLALGSGGAYGLAHVGVLAVLEEAGVPVDFVAGASMGAIIGAAYALGMSPAELREVAVRFGSVAGLIPMLPDLARIAFDLNLLRPGIFAGDRFLRLLTSFGPVPEATFADLVIPFRAVATDVDTGARVELCDGKLADAVRASASMPWMLSPCRFGDRVLVDGGMSDPVPSETVRSMGADLVIAVNVVPALDPRARSPLDAVARALDRLNPLSYLQRVRPLPNSFDVVMRSLLVLQHELGNARAGEADVLITPSLSEFWFLEFWAARALIEKGADAARAALPAIREARRVTVDSAFPPGRDATAKSR